MNYFTIHFGPNTDQEAICEILKQSGGDCIQQSSGLLAKSPHDENDLKKEISSLSENITIVPMDPQLAQTDPGYSKDARVFMGLQ